MTYSYGKILLTHLGERTKMTIKFRLDGRKWRWEKSHLFIDGKQQPLASGWDMYVAIYKDPDNGRRNFTPEGARKAAIPASQEVEGLLEALLLPGRQRFARHG